MKKISYLLLLAALGLASCGKLDDPNATTTTTTTGTTTTGTTTTTIPVVPTTPEQASIDDKNIKNYLTANNLTATKDTTGLYYKVITPGTGAKPISTSSIQVTYTGSLLNGTVFDQNLVPVTFVLSSLIGGWQIGLPFIKQGGQILLYIPSRYAYGSISPSTTVPANSVLIYNITLVVVQ